MKIKHLLGNIVWGWCAPWHKRHFQDSRARGHGTDTNLSADRNKKAQRHRDRKLSEICHEYDRFQEAIDYSTYRRADSPSHYDDEVPWSVPKLVKCLLMQMMSKILKSFDPIFILSILSALRWECDTYGAWRSCFLAVTVFKKRSSLRLSTQESVWSLNRIDFKKSAHLLRSVRPSATCLTCTQQTIWLQEQTPRKWKSLSRQINLL